MFNPINLIDIVRFFEGGLGGGLLITPFWLKFIICISEYKLFPVATQMHPWKNPAYTHAFVNDNESFTWVYQVIGIHKESESLSLP